MKQTAGLNHGLRVLSNLWAVVVHIGWQSTARFEDGQRAALEQDNGSEAQEDEEAHRVSRGRENHTGAHDGIAS